MKDLKISLIVPTYNRAEYTGIFLKYIVKYHQEDLFEIIFSDDGSTEDQFAVLSEYAKDLKIPCKLVIQEHQGYRLARVRNNGVRYSEGDYLCFLDQDLLPSEGYFRYVKKYAASTRFLITRPIYTTADERVKIFTASDNAWCSELMDKRRLRLYKLAAKDYIYHIGKRLGLGDRRPKLQGGAFSLYKDQFIRVNGFDENFQGWGLEDDDLGRRLYLNRIIGLNISHKAWVYHLHHQPAPTKGLRTNRDYYKSKNYNKHSNFAKNGYNLVISEKITFLRIK